MLVGLSACLSPPPVTDTDATSSGAASSSGGSSGTSSSGGDVMTSTAAESGSDGGPGDCADGSKNQGESDVDCGGPCEACPEGQACSGDADCATQACAAGTCVVATCREDADCPAPDAPCSRSACDPATLACAVVPADDGEPCDDGSLCSVTSACAAGACVATRPADCSGFDSPCTVGKCDEQTGACLAVDIADGIGCDDGDSCTIAEVCQAGSCVTDEAGALFFEDFSAPADGWLLDESWEFAPATASLPGTGGADPASDHSPGADQMLAGTVVGGLDGTPSHPRWCMTSPAIDTTPATGDLWLSFWRHLHAPALPKVVHTVQVYNGATWKTLATGHDVVTDDPAWTLVELNATGSQAVDFRVRICVERLAGAPDFAGWSVDDLTVASIACTP